MSPTVVLYVRIPEELMAAIDVAAYESRPKSSRQKVVTEILSRHLKPKVRR